MDNANDTVSQMRQTPVGEKETPAEMNTQMPSRTPSMDPCRRWTRDIGELRARAARTKRHAVSDSGLADLLGDALKTCESLLFELAGARLELDRVVSNAKDDAADWNYLFDRMPVACVATDANGVIASANRSAALLLNLSAKHLGYRVLLHFFDRRDSFCQLLQSLSVEPPPVRASLGLRPRERAVVSTDVIVIPRTPGDLTMWLWFLMPGHAVNRRTLTPGRTRSVLSTVDVCRQ
ncbi:MAG: PAS domain-containing protein [Acidobacteria bacterium]|nr:PAS domain-containing protein [Acidobacteriota bacterium]